MEDLLTLEEVERAVCKRCGLLAARPNNKFVVVRAMNKETGEADGPPSIWCVECVGKDN